ncbi:forkhead box protein P3 [Chanos chanos]|uniref:Forkhead box protein P3 n=1 Tax=Chanos chanos TaxID=29144 RepID=A0A6J2W9S8_CHACN|nr:forkhead box protein P3 [Chanos chanos]
MNQDIESGSAQIRSKGSSSLFINGRCTWPGCDSCFEEYPYFLKHLNNDHAFGDKAIAQWKIQQELVQHLENQLIVEKEKLQAMHHHLNLPEHRSVHMRAVSDWPGRLSVSGPLSMVTYGAAESVSKGPAELGQQGSWNTPVPNLLADFITGLEYYKHTNVRPPYTYAFLIRWSILESPDKQRTLNEIYNWFQRMFFYFRHNTATWKNAVRHNLSLHKCFVRVEGGKGAVWTVDEAEFQRRKGQKLNR